MDDSSVKGFTSSTPMTMTNSGGNNENDEIGSRKLQKSKKMVMKHFMSPTISAATKAASVPRKKILAERNEAFAFTNSPKPPIVSARSIRSYCSSDNDCDDEQNSFDGDSLLKKKKPYDPFTNYLSPRPKFLRYNPNKKRRIFLHGENEITERENGLGFVSTSSSFQSQKVVEEKTFEEGVVKKEDEELEMTVGNHNDYDDEEAEEMEESEEFEEEEKCWSLLGLLKFLLVLGSLVLSTSFIYSMYSPDPSLIQGAVWEFRGGYVNQSNIHVHEEVVTRKEEYFISEFKVMDGKGEESHISLLDVVMLKGMVDNKLVEAGISKGNGNGNGLSDSSAGLPDVNEVTIEKYEDVYYDMMMNKVEASDTLQWAVPKESEANNDIEMVDSEAEASFFEANECARDQDMERTRESFDQVQGAETVEVIKSFQEDLFSEIEPSTDLSAENDMMESEEIKLNLEVLALAVSLSIVAALGFLYQSRQRNIGKENYLPTQKNNGKENSFPTEKNNSKEDPLPIETHHTNAEPVEAAHQIQNSNAICSAKEKKVKKVEFVASPSTTPFPSMKKVVTEEFSRKSQAPIVELLGELVIGEEASSFFKSSKRRRVLDSEVKNGSNYLSTQMMISQNKASLVENQRYSPQLELLNMADFSSQKKSSVVKKEEGKGGEVSMASATPVRRSSRIRNKVSPC